MKVLDIIKIQEEIDIVPSSTMGPDGNPAGFNVVDTDNNNRVLRTFSDAGEAEEFRDEARATQARAQQRVSGDKVEVDQSKKTGAFKRAFQGTWRERFSRAARSVNFLATVVGVAAVATTWREHQEYQEDLMFAHVYGDNQGNRLTSQQYIELSTRAYEQWVTATLVIAVPAFVTAIRAGGRAAARIVRALRGINVATSAAMAVGGPVGIAAGVVKFVLFEAAMWAAIWVLSSTERARSVIRWCIANEYEDGLAGIASNAQQFATSLGADASQVIGNVTGAAVSGVLDMFGAEEASQDAERALSDIRDLVGQRPDARARDVAAGDQLGGNDGGDAPAPETATGSQSMVPPPPSN